MSERNPDRPKLEDALAALRREQLDPQTEAASGERVWSQMQSALGEVEAEVQHIRSCADVRLLLPALRSGHLSPARALLVRDHLRDCVACRRYAHGENIDSGAAAWKTETPAISAWNWRGIGVAAAVLVVAAITTFGLLGYFATPAGARATLQSAEGQVYVLSAASAKLLQPGAQIAEGESVRTSAGGHAFLKLLDGSVVELNERTQLAVSAQRYDTTLMLDGGKIIVQAAKRNRGHLYVKAHDLRAAVTGTIFSVNSGLKGSRVAVIEGAVQVAANGTDSLLQSGDETNTSAASGYVPVAKEISWSQNLDNHLALLAEFAKLKQNIEANVQLPGPRYQSAILPLAPPDTLLYVSIPNLGEALGQANEIFQQQLQDSPVLSQWWTQTHSADSRTRFTQMVERMRQLSRYLGDEVVVLGIGGWGPDAGVAALARINDAGIASYLQGEVERINAESTDGGHIVIVNPQQLASMPATQDSKQLLILIRPDYLVVAPTVVGLQRINAQLDAGASGFAASDFGKAISASYTRGAGILVAANLEAMQARSTNPRAGLQAAGFGNVHFLILEHRDQNGQADNRATLNFNGPRTGIASWLAAPAPVRSLEFISPDASIVFAGLSKSPAAMFDDVMAIAATRPDGAQREQNLEQELGISLRNDIAAALGGDVAVALDGPPLPTPAWKAVFEVNDSARLQNAIIQVVQRVNQKLAANN
ncbi:MAG TPA: FecR domain-containing protein, partial [Terriglobales bacterium]|nr:FecR domain-containing protein [Terriglobales bacterium]